MTTGNWARIIVLVASVLFFPVAILAYTFIPALAPLIPLKALIIVLVICAIYVFASSRALKKQFEAMAIQKSAPVGNVQVDPAEDVLSDKFE